MSDWYEAHGKRALDLLCAGAAVAALSPVLGIAAALVRLSSRGPAIYRQQRVGACRSRFTMYKFRSMPVNTQVVTSAEAGTLRVTPVGRVLRRTNVDELPQLFNILRGDMSIVGPRPALPSQEELLAHRTDDGAGRLRPGLTGLAQVKSFNGMTPTQKAAWDERYALRVTFVGDLRIIASTFSYLTKPPPRY